MLLLSLEVSMLICAWLRCLDDAIFDSDLDVVIAPGLTVNFVLVHVGKQEVFDVDW